MPDSLSDCRDSLIPFLLNVLLPSLTHDKPWIHWRTFVARYSLRSAVLHTCCWSYRQETWILCLSHLLSFNTLSQLLTFQSISSLWVFSFHQIAFECFDVVCESTLLFLGWLRESVQASFAAPRFFPLCSLLMHFLLKTFAASNLLSSSLLSSCMQELCDFTSLGFLYFQCWDSQCISPFHGGFPRVFDSAFKGWMLSLLTPWVFSHLYRSLNLAKLRSFLQSCREDQIFLVNFWTWTKDQVS